MRLEFVNCLGFSILPFVTLGLFFQGVVVVIFSWGDGIPVGDLDFLTLQAFRS